MTAALLLAFLLLPPASLRYERTLSLQGSGQACAALDPLVFPRAAPSLRDLRLYAQGRELPYAITLSQPAEPEDGTARVLNLTRTGTGVAFDLEMPERPYTEVILGLQAHDFRITAQVSASDDLNAAHRTELGTFTLFDLTAQHLSRNTAIALQETSFRYLHLDLTSASPFDPGIVQPAIVPPSREAQTIYAEVARTSTFAPRGRDTIATFRIPARVPVERVRILTAPGFHGNFSRSVRVTARSDAPGTVLETVDGTIARVERGDLRQQEMSFPAALGANLQGEATVEVAILNRDQPPLPLAAVTLQMRQRQLCFDSSEPQAELFYGSPDLAAPAYEYAQTFTPSIHPITARLGPEQVNPRFRDTPEALSFRERHPEFAWVLLLAAVALGGTFTLRAWHRLHR